MKFHIDYNAHISHIYNLSDISCSVSDISYFAFVCGGYTFIMSVGAIEVPAIKL